MSINPFANIGQTVLYLSGAAILSVVVTKTVIRQRRDNNFRPHARDTDEDAGKEEGDYYSNLAKVKPGFPLEQGKSNERSRKSEFEGAGLSYKSRKGGDRLGFLDRRRGADDDNTK
ncbi:Coi1p Ecym_4631 [Eremothecium cymbalariae DBVPG|uniref:Uncharacterized protein n=1 Tax=Eremothecium cymbalariae (strain CBS 270.75 / DBVPG 7215 / KCTC 17166 / NRRL Y-17582) TaxID=931890 RepID=G8JSD4_ERECY|nr:hypothetical protein Ecym_4631 [Eremothecium cymbalariae DBVPG\